MKRSCAVTRDRNVFASRKMIGCGIEEKTTGWSLAQRTGNIFKIWVLLKNRHKNYMVKLVNGR